MSTYQDIEAAHKAAKAAIDAVKFHVGPMIRLSAGHLRSVELTWQTVDALRALKAELRSFDSRTGTWK